MAKTAKTNLEFLLVKAELKGIPEKGLLRSRNIGQVDLIWPVSVQKVRRFLRLTAKYALKTLCASSAVTFLSAAL